MTMPRGRGAPRLDPERGTRVGGARTRAGVTSRGVSRRRSRTGGGLRALAFVAVLAGVVLLGIVTVLNPALRGLARGLADGNPEMMRFGFVADVVKSDLGGALTTAASADATPIPFTIAPGDTRTQVGAKLAALRLIKDPLVYDYYFITRGLAGKLQTGVYTIDKTMTPEQIAVRLSGSPDPPKAKLVIGLREGLRLEQIVTVLERDDMHDAGLTMDVKAFYDLVSKPPKALRDDYDFLTTLPQGRSLEGYLAAGSYSVEPDISAEAFVRQLLDAWGAENSDAVKAASDAGKDFYEVLTLASIVEKEAAVDEERAKIAGVYVNRLDPKLNQSTRTLGADPVVFYGYDTAQLRKIDMADWVTYAFNIKPTNTNVGDIRLPDDLAQYQSYTVAGLPPGPIATPGRASIQAALAPDTADKYLYFVAACDGSRTHLFAKNGTEHRKNIESCAGGSKATPTQSP